MNKKDFDVYVRGFIIYFVANMVFAYFGWWGFDDDNRLLVILKVTAIHWTVMWVVGKFIFVVFAALLQVCFGILGIIFAMWLPELLEGLTLMLLPPWSLTLIAGSWGKFCMGLFYLFSLFFILPLNLKGSRKKEGEEVAVGDQGDDSGEAVAGKAVVELKQK